MDAALMKTMLESHERAFNSSMQFMMNHMKEQINKLENKVMDLTTSLEFTQREVDDLKSNAKDHEKEKKETKTKLDQLTEELESSNKKIMELEDKINYQEDYSRRKNIRINGMEERGPETWEQTTTAVTSLLEDKMELPGLVLERAHRVGPHREGKPRTIVARFTRYCDREAVLRNGKKLKGSNIFVNEDLSAASQAVKSSQFPMMREARAQGKIAFFRHTKLIIRERTTDNATRQNQPPVTEEGAVGGVEGDSRVGAAGPADVAGRVTDSQVAGVWSGGAERGGASPSLTLSRTGVSRTQSPAAPTASSQRNTTKKTGLRSTTTRK